MEGSPNRTEIDGSSIERKLIAGALESLGYVEVEESEYEAEQDLRCGAMIITALLKNPETPLAQTTSEDTVAPEKRAELTETVNEYLENGEFSDNQTGGVSIFIKGIVRRLLGNPRRREAFLSVIREAQTGNYQRLDAVIKQIEAIATRFAERATNPKVLMIGHLGQLALSPLTGEHGTSTEVLDALAAAASTPNLGLATVAAELLTVSQGKVNLEFLDISDAEALAAALKKGDYKTVMLQATSETMQAVCKQARAFSAAGINVVIGGVATMLDERYLLEQTSAHLWIGEVEGRGDLLSKLALEDGNVRTVVFRGHRDLPSRDGITDLNTLQANRTRIEYVNMDQDYSPAVENRTGRLKYRLMAQEMMKPFVQVGGKYYEVPVASHEIIFSKGCPFVCEFCSTTKTEGQKARRRSVSSIINELSALGLTYTENADAATKAKFTRSVYLAVPDQNAFDIGAGEDPTEWIEYMQDLFSNLADRRVCLATQTSLASFMKIAVQARVMVGRANDALNEVYEHETPEGVAVANRILGTDLPNPVAIRVYAIEQEKKYRELDRQVGKVVVSALVGVEQEGRVSGAQTHGKTSTVIAVEWDKMSSDEIVEEFRQNGDDIFRIGKDSSYYPGIIAYARKIGIPLIGSCIYGLPDDLSAGSGGHEGNENPQEIVDEWMNFLVQKLDMDLAMVQAFIAVFGTTGFRKVHRNTTAGDEYYEHPEDFENAESAEMAAKIVREFYSLKRVFPRMIKRYGSYSRNRYIAMALINVAFLAQNAQSDGSGNVVHGMLNGPYSHRQVLLPEI